MTGELLAEQDRLAHYGPINVLEGSADEHVLLLSDDAGVNFRRSAGAAG
jgi:hypothetical protein